MPETVQSSMTMPFVEFVTDLPINPEPKGSALPSFVVPRTSHPENVCCEYAFVS